MTAELNIKLKLTTKMLPGNVTAGMFSLESPLFVTKHLEFPGQPCVSSNTVSQPDTRDAL